MKYLHCNLVKLILRKTPNFVTIVCENKNSLYQFVFFYLLNQIIVALNSFYQ